MTSGDLAGILLPCARVAAVLGGLTGAARGCGVSGGLTLVPVTPQLRTTIGCGGPPSDSCFRELDSRLEAFLVAASGDCPIGYIETRVQAGKPAQAAVVWYREETLLAPVAGGGGVVARAVRAVARAWGGETGSATPMGPSRQVP